METAALPRQTLRHDAVDVRASAKSIQDASKYAIVRLDALIAQNGEFSDLASEMRDVYAGFQKLGEDIGATSEFIGAALKAR